MSNLCLLDSVLRCKDAGRETELLPKPNELCILVEVERQYTEKIRVIRWNGHYRGTVFPRGLIKGSLRKEYLI